MYVYSMTVYLAARYSRREELLKYREQIEKEGHVVSSRWLNGHHEIDRDGLSLEATFEQRRKFAYEDFVDVLHADLLIAFTETPRSSNSRGGRHVEVGIALGRQAMVWIVGPRENVFYCLNEVRQFDDWPSALAALQNEFTK